MPTGTRLIHRRYESGVFSYRIILRQWSADNNYWSAEWVCVENGKKGELRYAGLGAGAAERQAHHQIDLDNRRTDSEQHDFQN